jgi:thiol-disulfide isomerase/thioredoxin
MQQSSNTTRVEWMRQIGRQANRCATRFAGPCLAMMMMIGLAGCGQIDLGFLASSGQEQEGPAAAEEQDPGSGGLPAGLVGESAEAVQRLLGAPLGRLHTTGGMVWLYPQWRVQLDDQRVVIAVERELAATVASPVGGSPAAQRPLTVVSNGGQEVNLAALLAPGKITVVDFYADWCGPCRQVSPHLERLAREDPDVNVVKVDIVKWNTPVTRQHNIRSVPNMRVYDRSGRMVGSSTSDFRQVLRNVDQAKR